MAKEGCPKFNSQPGRGLNSGPQLWLAVGDLTNCASLAHNRFKQVWDDIKSSLTVTPAPTCSLITYNLFGAVSQRNWAKELYSKMLLNSTLYLTAALAEQAQIVVLFETVTLALINVTAILWNLLVCGSVFRNKRLRTVPNTFVVALAISDILTSSLAMPLSVGVLSAGNIPYGPTVSLPGLLYLHVRPDISTNNGDNRPQ